ncbi:B12-binding domain-containing radical SAM protein [bacterium]|nr:B12-binding domain-containing radical SAM protein [bacterium]
MKVVLINAPRKIPQVADFPPLGLAYIGAVAKQAGHYVRIIDAAAWSFDDLSQAVRREAPEVIGITCWTIERGQAFKAAHVAKEAAPNARVIMGGPHATAFPEHMFLRAPTDYVALGEGEETIQELLDVIAKDGDVSKVKGIAYQRDGECHRTERRPFITDLDSIPLPLHEEFDYRQYNGMHDSARRAAAIITSRGCPFRCTFCSSTVYWGRKYRKRSVENVLTEIELLYQYHGIRALLFFDDNLVIDRNRCIALCQALCARNNRRLRLTAKGMDLIWAAEGSVKVDPELLGWMKRAGCYRIDFGVESGSPKILKNINKAFTVQDTRNAFRLCREAGIRPNAYLMFGAPGETRRTINETVRLMREISPTSLVGGRPGVWILPDTELYELSKRQGIISDKTWLQTDETLYYTGEHSEKELLALVRQYNRGMVRGAGWLMHLRLLWSQACQVLPRWVANLVFRLLRKLRGFAQKINGRSTT